MNLKIEKDLKTNKILFTVKTKARDDAKRLVFAFFIAFFIHLMAFTLFRVDLGDFFGSESMPAVSYVLADSGGSVTGLLEEEKQSDEWPSYLIRERLKAPEIPFFLVGPSQDFSFQAFRPDLEPIFFEAPPLCKSSWRFSGGLFEAKSLPEFTCIGMRRATFLFRLQDNGIFWLDMIQSTGDARLDKALEDSIKTLELTSAAQEGTLTVEFSP